MSFLVVSVQSWKAMSEYREANRITTKTPQIFFFIHWGMIHNELVP